MANEFKTPKDVVKFAKDEGVEFIDLKFMDLPGTWQHVGMPVSQFDESFFEDGKGFDGSSIRGWRSIESSDMLLRPEVKSARIDPFYARTTLSLICNVFDPVTGQSYERDPRAVAQRAEEYLKSTGIATTSFFGPEAEFFLFDDVRFDSAQNGAFYKVDSDEGKWNSGRDEGGRFGPKNDCAGDGGSHDSSQQESDRPRSADIIEDGQLINATDESAAASVSQFDWDAAESVVAADSEARSAINQYASGGHDANGFFRYGETEESLVDFAERIGSTPEQMRRIAAATEAAVLAIA